MSASQNTESDEEWEGECNPKLEVRTTAIHGRGLFATDLIKKGEVIWNFVMDKRYTFSLEQINSWDPVTRDRFLWYAIQTDEDKYVGQVKEEELMEDWANFQNHSCDPNCWFSSDTELVARYDILPDEEVTFDYCTSDVTLLDFDNCQCGSKLCRF
jgi:SET domain-containing protein